MVGTKTGLSGVRLAKAIGRKQYLTLKAGAYTACLFHFMYIIVDWVALWPIVQAGGNPCIPNNANQKKLPFVYVDSWPTVSRSSSLWSSSALPV